MAALPYSFTMATDKLAGREAPAASCFSDWLEPNLLEDPSLQSVCHWAAECVCAGFHTRQKDAITEIIKHVWRWVTAVCSKGLSFYRAIQFSFFSWFICSDNQRHRKVEYNLNHYGINNHKISEKSKKISIATILYVIIWLMVLSQNNRMAFVIKNKY